jgi:hypothetical protein
METIKIFVGNFTFLDETIDGMHECIINSIEGVYKAIDEDQADIMSEKLLEQYDGYLIPSIYTGKIRFSNETIEKQYKRLL